MKINLSKTYMQGVPCLIPAYLGDREILDKFEPYQLLRGTIRKDRNPKFHDKFFAILRMVVNNAHDEHGEQKWATVEQLLTALKFKLGLYDIVKGFDGEAQYHPRSIAFENMDDFEFDTLVYTPSLPVLAKELNTTISEMEQNYAGNL